ncbi:hypothetical protein EDB86DRAFT_2824352 [Lactarius hatsudake]|nr:hypothetical protein EDB86DRAFT_2824352 [Lactarius hatsudake]
MSQAEQTQSFMCGLQLDMEQQVKQKLQLKFPDHNQQDPYRLEELYDAASYVIQGRATATISGVTLVGSPTSPSAKIKTEIQTVMATAVTTLGEMFKNALESHSAGNQVRNTGITCPAEQTTKCNFCGVPGHFMQNPGQVVAVQILLEMSGPTMVAEPPTAKTVRFTEECPEPGQVGVYAFRRGFVPRTSGRPRTRFDGPPTACIQQIDEDKDREPSPHHQDPPPHLEKATAETTPREHPFAKIQEVAQVTTKANQADSNSPANAIGKCRNKHAYTSNAAIYGEKATSKVYERMMDTEVTVTQCELLSLAPELRAQVSKPMTKRQIACVNAQESAEETAKPKMKRLAESHMLVAFSVARCSPPGNTTIIADPYEALLKAHPMEGDSSQEAIEVATESNALRAILPVVDGSEKVEAILDPSCQIIAMSEEVCNVLAILYDPSICLNMISVNSSIDQSLGLARNIPFHVSKITLYLQVYILQSLAYNILLGWPFDILAQSAVCIYQNEDQTITILDPNTGKMATVPTVPHSSN